MGTGSGVASGVGPAARVDGIAVGTGLCGDADLTTGVAVSAGTLFEAERVALAGATEEAAVGAEEGPAEAAVASLRLLVAEAVDDSSSPQAASRMAQAMTTRQNIPDALFLTRFQPIYIS